MKRFVYSLSVLLLSIPVAMAQAGSGQGSGSIGGPAAATTALCTLSSWSTPAIDTIAILILVIGIVAAAFELFKRSIGWAIGLFIGASVMFAVLWGIAGPISSVLSSMASAINGGTSACTSNG